MKSIEIYFLGVFFLPFVTSSNDQCTHVFTEDFQKCGNRADEQLTFDQMKQNRLYNLSEPTQPECTNIQFNGPCRRIFKLTRIMRQSFGSKTLVQISDMLRRCCGPCAKYHRTDLTIPLSESNMTEIQNSDIVFPIPAQSKLIEDLHGFRYIPLFDVPSAFYITLQASEEQLTKDMIDGCLSNWPLLIICLLLALIAGFVAWILETWSNDEEFPRCFPLGLWEGFWWSFVSMTTVGYTIFIYFFQLPGSSGKSGRMNWENFETKNGGYAKWL